MGCVYSHPGQNRGSSANKKRQPDYHPRPKPSQKSKTTPNPPPTKSASLPPSEPKPPSTPLKPPEEELPQFRRGNFDRNSVLRQSKKRSRKNSSASLNNSKALNASTLDQSVTNNHVNHVNNEVTNGSKPLNALESRKSSYTSPKSNNENTTKIEVASDFLHEKRNVYDAFEDNSHRFSTFGKAPESIRKESNTTTVSAIVNEENRKYSAKLNESSQFVNSFLNEKPSNNCTPEESSKSHRKESIEEMMIDSRKLSAIEERWKSSSSSSQRKTSNEEQQRKISSASANVAALLGKLSAPEDIKIDVWNNESSSERSRETRNNLSITNGFSPTDLLEITTARDKTSPPRKSSEKQLPESRSTSRSRRSPAKEDCNPSSSSSSSTKAAEDLVEEDCGRLI